MLEKNGKASVSKSTKNINIRLLFFTDRINNKEITVDCFPMNGMKVYFMTKPLQGNLFNKFRYIIMGVIPNRK